MAEDRVINWNDPSRTPSLADIKQVLENFLGGVGAVRWHDDRFFVDLPGTPTHPLKGFKEIILQPAYDKRWIEVRPHFDPHVCSS